PADSVGCVGAALSPLSPGRSGRGGSDGGFAAALGAVVSGGGLYAGPGVGSARRFQASGGGASGGGLDDAGRAGAGGGGTEGQGGDPGPQPRAAWRARVGGSVDRAGLGT